VIDYRDIEVAEEVDGLRLDRFLAARFAGFSRTVLARAIREGLVSEPTGRVLRASRRVRAGEWLRVRIPGIAPTGAPPPLPPVLYEDDRVVVLDKPPGLPCHPGGTAFTWSVVGLARARWPGADLAHRLDKETSGALILTKDRAANAFVKAAFKASHPEKIYVALARGAVSVSGDVTAPIGSADGHIRIQMAVRAGGLTARTTFATEGVRTAGGVTLTRVRCVLHSGRTHQIRVHLAHVADGIVGDRMYGVPPEVFLRAWEHGVDDDVIVAAGAPRQALHAQTITFDHPDGGSRTVTAPEPADIARWWADPSVLPLDR